MNARECMIVDLEPGGGRRKFKTESVETISMNERGLWAVKFAGNQRVFNYNPARLLYLTQPERIDLEEKGLYVGGKHITDVAELYRFSDERHVYFHAIHQNGFYEDFEGKEVYVTRTRIDETGGSTWDYLKKLAEETGLLTEDDESILSKQYELVDVMRDNVPLAQFLGDKEKLRTYSLPRVIYYPFGCNASQKKAVEAALTYQVSIIQGPPGTGKTQTILNIIANLLVQGNTVLVVSNNNSAVENVEEKLAGEGLDFLVAKLGSRENKEQFISSQKGYPEMTEWKLTDKNEAERQAKEALGVVSQGFESQKKKALLKTELDALKTESKYNETQLNRKIDNDWLCRKSSASLMKLLLAYRLLLERERKPGIWFRLRWSFAIGFKAFSFLLEDEKDVIAALESAYYVAWANEIESELQLIEEYLAENDIPQAVKSLRNNSLKVLKHYVSNRFAGSRRVFKINEIKSWSEEFLQEYPVVLSTTYSAKSCISKDMVFDYVIMDEASQVDVKTGALALSCAMNAVIVGDDKQLPNVVSREEMKALEAIESAYGVEERYQASANSFLQSCAKVFTDAPVTLLREHYRCHPKIIEFCNKLFYDGELVAMTTDEGEENVLQVVRTVAGNHARGHFNQREIDVIASEIIPQCLKDESVGIITPYREQANAINSLLDKDIASTVHKYQGRECDTIIMSMVDNAPTEFSDDANLMNVAISRAKTRLCVVTNGNEIPQDSNLAQLIAYMQYNNFEVKESKLHSVFDLLYKQYTAERLEYEKEHPGVSDFLSERLIFDTLSAAIKETGLRNVDLIPQYPLSRLIADRSLLDDRELAFSDSGFSHVDLLVYNSLTKRPLLAIEVDGWKYHGDSEVQQSRDSLKDNILKKMKLSLKRISTTETVTVGTLKDMLRTCMVN